MTRSADRRDVAPTELCVCVCVMAKAPEIRGRQHVWVVLSTLTMATLTPSLGSSDDLIVYH